MIDLDPFLIVSLHQIHLIPDHLQSRLPIIMPPIPPGIHGGGWHQSTKSTLQALHLEHESGSEMRSIIDLGAGTGIVSVAASLLGAVRIFATEIDSRAADFAAEVFRVNEIEVQWLDPDDLDKWPRVDLCISNLGPKAINIRKGSLSLQWCKMIVVDGFGAWVTIDPYSVDDIRNAQLHRPGSHPDTVRMLRPESSGMTTPEAARHLMAYLTEADLDDIPTPISIAGSLSLSLSRVMKAERARIQGVMDVQFGPGEVRIDI